MVWLVSTDAKINVTTLMDGSGGHKWQNVFLKALPDGSPQILQSPNLSLGIVSTMDEVT